MKKQLICAVAMFMGVQLAAAQNVDLNKEYADPASVLRRVLSQVPNNIICGGAKNYIRDTLKYVETIPPQQLYAVRMQAYQAVESAKDGSCLPRNHVFR